ncbi:protein-L-isoaspartate O-methyltransferase family protein [Candidatus Magnetaquiglobus chichijimensis]
MDIQQKGMMTMDYNLARVNMVKSQAVPNMVLDETLLAGMLRVSREAFTTPAHRMLAYSDMPVAWNDSGRRSLTPLQTGQMIQALALSAGDRVLVIGAGSGYESALLAAMGMKVFALESDAELAARGARLTEGADVTWRVAPLADGWSEAGRYDGILICGAVATVPNKIVGQMQPDGALTAILGLTGDVVMRGVKISGVPAREEALFDTVAPILPGFGDGGFRV